MNPIQNRHSSEFRELCQELKRLRDAAGGQSVWPRPQLDLFHDAGVYRWFVPHDHGGSGWSQTDLMAAYIELSAACLSSTFILTQRVAALKRIFQSANTDLVARLGPGLLSGSTPATVGISHLTTSRRHIAQPVLQAINHPEGYLLNGYSPWVTGANDATFLVVGAQLDANRQILALVESGQVGVQIEPGFPLIALGETHTGMVRFRDVLIPGNAILAGPSPDVLAGAGSGPSTGSFQTSALALGVASAAIRFLSDEARQRPALGPGLTALSAQFDQNRSALLAATEGLTAGSNEQLRTDSNSLVLRATQAAMVAAKGAGFVQGHPVGRWCQESLFFLVWSCPQAVLDANLCQLAGIEND